MSPGGYPSPENTSGGSHGPYHGHNGYQATTEQSEGTLMDVLRATQGVSSNGVQSGSIPAADMNGHPGASDSPSQLTGSPTQHIFDASAPHLDEHGQIIQYNHYQPNDPNADSARKRSKVSRACDECRRKKVSLSQLMFYSVLQALPHLYRSYNRSTTRCAPTIMHRPKEKQGEILPGFY